MKAVVETYNHNKMFTFVEKITAPAFTNCQHGFYSNMNLSRPCISAYLSGIQPNGDEKCRYVLVLAIIGVLIKAYVVMFMQVINDEIRKSQSCHILVFPASHEMDK